MLNDTMTLREQHEAAALAAGLSIRWVERACKGGHVGAAFIGDVPWRPRDDDGDAFRLAAYLNHKGLSIILGSNTIIVGDWVQAPTVNNSGDSCIAIRAAIFRAAVAEGQRLVAMNTAKLHLVFDLGGDDKTAVFDLDEDLDNEPECEHCRGDGMDPDCDNLLPCPMCQGEQRP